MADGLRHRLLRGEEVSYLEYGLRADASPTLQKRTLQRLCEWYEQGRILANAPAIQPLLHSLMGSQHVLVRRWAIKALALIGHPDDFQRIVDRLKVEEDVEAQTWGVTGLVKHARDRGLKEICEMAGLPNSAAITLAARLYAPDSWIADHTEQPRISLGDDQLTLKWAVFLIGYGRAPEDLFHPRFSNEVFLGELNAHDAPEISEYSVWALWERPDFGAAFSKIPLIDAKKHQESVRKWLYRLATKSPDQAGLDPDTLSALRSDDSSRAREGLAQGVVDLEPAMFGRTVLDWYAIEPDPQVQENLLVSMAAASARDIDYADAVQERFGREQPDSLLRRRLLAASVNQPLFGDLRQRHAQDAIARQGLLAYGNQNVIIGDVNVSGPTLNIGGNLNAQNLAVGDMINSANAAVQHLERSDAGAAQALQQVLAMLAQSKVPDGDGAVAAAVKQVADAPTAENKKSLLDRLKDYGAKAAALGTVVTGFDAAFDAVKGLLA